MELAENRGVCERERQSSVEFDLEQYARVLYVYIYATGEIRAGVLK